jgi:hypothetical protein
LHDLSANLAREQVRLDLATRIGPKNIVDPRRETASRHLQHRDQGSVARLLARPDGVGLLIAPFTLLGVHSWP